MSGKKETQRNVEEQHILLEKLSKFKYNDLKNYFEKQPLKVLHKLKLYMDDNYEYGDVELNDDQYDLLVNVIRQKDPSYIPPIGFKIREDDNRVIVPYHMGSMEKIRPHIPEEVSALHKWLSEYKTEEYVIEDKLDGISCLIVVDEKGKYTLYKRPGRDGYGADITHLLPYLKTIPKSLSSPIVVRGELIVRKDIFESKYRKKGGGYKENNYKTPRGMVAGITGAKTARKGISDIEFIAYEKYYDDGVIGLKPTDQLHELASLGFLTVKYELVDELNINILTELLVRFKENSSYEIDGIIVQPNEPYERVLSGNPPNAFAYKMLRPDAIVEAKVKRVIWKVSRRGKLKPRLEIYPVIIDGYENTYATAFNAKYIVDNKLGPNSKILITRSGDIIPYIVKIISSSSESQMPDIPYFWKGVDIYAEGEKNEKCIAIMNHFFTTIRAKHLGESTLRKIYNHGLNTLFKIILATKEDFAKIDGFGKGLVDRTYKSIHDALEAGVTIPELLGGTGIFNEGIGPKLVSQLLENIPDIFDRYKTMSKIDLLHLVMSIPDFGPNRSQKIVDNLYWADVFIQAMSLYAIIKRIEITDTDLAGMSFVFTGFKDKSLEEAIIAKGGKTVTSVSKKTSGVIMARKNNLTAPSGKYKKAMEMNIPVYTRDEFINKFIPTFEK